MLYKRIVACNICGSAEQRELYSDELGERAAPTGYDFTPETRKTYRIVKCSNCGLVFTNPMPTLLESYADHVDQTYLSSQPQRRSTARRSVQRLLRHVRGGRLLDIGCSIGIFLDEASPHFEVEGLELSRWAAAIASQRHRVHQVTLKEFQPTRPFDAITLWGVIEHFEDPRAELSRIHGLLAGQGVLAIYTGDLDASLPRLLGKKWWWFQGMHLHYFSCRTLSRLLGDAGFEVLSYELMTVDFELHSLAVSLNRYSFGRWLGPILSSRPLRSIKVPLRLSGEMILFARKAEE
jgi:SAM-dependent methyltransferase